MLYKCVINHSGVDIPITNLDFKLKVISMKAKLLPITYDLDLMNYKILKVRNSCVWEFLTNSISCYTLKLYQTERQLILYTNCLINSIKFN